MEDDLSCSKVFDLSVQLKEVLVTFPENGQYKKYLTFLFFFL
jgi:hypothetical protein